jgi:hypothetical protein
MQGASSQESHAGRRRALVDAAAFDGGWPYYAGQASRLEPTAWAVIALAATSDSSSERPVSAGRAFLRGVQRHDGLLVDAGTAGPNFAWNALTLLADVAVSQDDPGSWRARLVADLLNVRGVALEGASADIRQDSRLRAWSWTAGTFSWVEPTAVALLALKKVRAAGAAATTRVTEAEALLLDRVCDGGGWNYGNSQVFGQDLRPYVPTTALALLAMQDRRDHSVVTRSLAWLIAHAESERSAMALSLAAICLQVFGVPTDAVRARLLEQESRTGFLGSRHLAAMAFYALTIPRHRARTFEVS